MKKIVIIKLGALGDLVRTLSVLPAIKDKYPESEITWITRKNALEVFEGNPHVKKLFALPYNFSEKEFDILYNFDVDEEATKLASEIQAKEKYGFYSDGGFASAFNLPAEYYLNTIFDDNLKKTNKKTYQEMMFQVAELNYKKQHCPIFLNSTDKKYATDFVEKNKISTENLIGIHIGASSRWPSKVWHIEELKKFIRLAKSKGYEIIIFAGNDEKESQKKLIDELIKEGLAVFKNNPENTIKQFASLVNICKVLVCSDSLALHVSLSLKKPTVGLFFCTSANEIEDYGVLKKLVSVKLCDFFPEKMNEYDENLTKSISAETVFNTVENILKN